ncbi:hypothetical protein LEM8419_02047 [Neolewinella maritima]|uniref:Fido domain-containing protein n=1 Tax=Neolewinella maritima TaxID=1383882 RepID=A0ABM9B1G1_9BACT|nr:type II toxin-antitoxin system death-on-curing family toxin [Neolewinella maritima]CAH1001112.1 hypothetical protein LEM8419_02047 [Neolewinella maritima]
MPPESLLHGESLEYLVETVQAEMFGAPLYPTLADKAALYMFNIVSNHIFQDGNKRTGLEAANVFIQANGSRLNDYLTPIRFEHRSIPSQAGTDKVQHLIAFTLEVASGTVPLPACQQWFAENITPIP